MKKKNFLIITGILVVIIIVGLVFIFKNSNKEYKYEATLNENMLNYDLTIDGGKSLSGDLYSYDGEWLAEIKDGKAIINEIDINNYPKFKIKVDGKVYTITKK